MYKQNWMYILKNVGRYLKWKERVENPMLLAMIKKRTNIFSMIVLLKALKVVEVFALTRIR